MTDALWTPSRKRIEDANITRFISELVNQDCFPRGTDYWGLHQWAVAEPELFWSAVWDFCGVVASKRGSDVLVEDGSIPGTKWFPDARLNFAENLLRFRDSSPALVSVLETGFRREMSYAELYEQVAALSAAMRLSGVKAGDRVAGFVPNIIESVVAMLAATSIGAIWSSCSPDFGTKGVIDRFQQIQPKMIFAADGYFYGGKTLDCLQRLKEIVSQLDELEQVVVIPLVCDKPEIDEVQNAILYEDYLEKDVAEIVFEQLAFDHPVYVMYSSGTTGVPKCIVHGAGGTLLQHLKEHQLMVDLKREDVLFYFTTCGWMMWNWLVSGLATGSTVVLYDGSPFAQEGRALLDLIDAEAITVFGTSAKYIFALEKQGHKPKNTHSLGSLKTILSTGSPLSQESFKYVYREIASDVCLSSISGGTDILSLFVGGCPVLPVYTGEIQAPAIGMAVDIWDDEGHSIIEKKGELVCTRPIPCCPIKFWNDEGGDKFHEAYFSRFPNVWSQGDFGEITRHGGFIIHGRSDAVLNPGGVRIGTSEIYRQVECIEEVLESVVVGQQWQGDVRVILFVVLRQGAILNDALCDKIRSLIRENATPRHVPAEIIQVSDVPRTRSGKLAELAVSDVVHGRKVKNTFALANPESLKCFEGFN